MLQLSKAKIRDQVLKHSIDADASTTVETVKMLLDGFLNKRKLLTKLRTLGRTLGRHL